MNFKIRKHYFRCICKLILMNIAFMAIKLYINNIIAIKIKLINYLPMTSRLSFVGPQVGSSGSTDQSLNPKFKIKIRI